MGCMAFSHRESAANWHFSTLIRMIGVNSTHHFVGKTLFACERDGIGSVKAKSIDASSPGLARHVT